MEEADRVLTIRNGFTEEEFRRLRQLLAALAQKQTERKEGKK